MQSDYSRVREVVTCSSAEIANKWIAGGWTLLNVLNRTKLLEAVPTMEIVFVLGWNSPGDILYVDPAESIAEITRKYKEHEEKSMIF